MRYRFLIAFLALPLSTLAAQATEEPPEPSCDLARRAHDNPISDHGGWTMRRYEWHAFYASVSTLAAYGIHKTTKLPRWASAAIATVGIGLIPHIRGGLIKHEYPVDLRDWGFDLFDRAAPTFLVLGQSGNSWQAKAIAATTYAGGYLALACYASP